MKLKHLVCILFFFSQFLQLQAQYLFTGNLQENSEYSTAYLSLVEDYRKISGIYEDQIISRATIKGDSFRFSGANLDRANRIYRIHIDSCNENIENGHFNGQCNASRSIVFVANVTDTIHFPITFENQLLCSLESVKEHTKVLSRIDSLKELMTYDYLSYRSQTNININNKNWFLKLQEFGESLNEPLAELYSYQLLSDRSSQFYDYYLRDLKSNSYYDALLERLQSKYPKASFTKQYELELATDKYRNELSETTSFNWKPWLFALPALVLLIIVMYTSGKKKPKKMISTGGLTQQEQKILDLILENKTNKEIAQEIFISVSTVKTHINNLYKKLNVTSRDQVKLLFNK